MTDTHEHPRRGTAIPRWTIVGEDLEAGFAEHDVLVPADLVAALRDLAADCAVELRSLLLTAHLKVLSQLSSERAVLTRYGTGSCQLTVGEGPWRTLITAAAHASRRADPRPSTTIETALDLAGVDGESRDGDALDPEVVLHTSYAGGYARAGYAGAGEGLRLRLRYRRDVVNSAFAGRVAGYHLAALRLMTADPDAAHHLGSLLSEAELRTQLEDLAGPREPLGDRLFVELFEDQARRRPDDIAAVHGERRWTYGQLNERANQIAGLLLRRGLRAEDPVAVVLGRTLDWLATTLGVLKAGGVYLPVRPDFPPERVADQLARSACRFAVTEPGSEATLHAATARVTSDLAVLRVTEAYAQPDATGNPGIAIEPGQLAYIYFTSGSTGAPKGAMCEHAGMLNHLQMKIADMRLGSGDVVTQTASQCFDISLWQLVAPLLVGGRTAIIDTEAQLDVGRFLDEVAGGGVHVVQVVPSYLDVMLSQLERRPRPLGDLRSVSVTGEALKRELVRRWFALYPDVTLVNAYGATEVSDDTMHEVLDRVPARDFVAVGRSRRNVHTYVLDEHQRVVPLGAPGEIAFSGVCVGRGYINDPERTAQAFTTDRYRPGTRLYRTGDFGRWLPEGTIEFLGRRDEQVKIRGFRIEIGEIENTLLRMPGVRHAAVVIARAGDGQDGQLDTKTLVAFFTGSEALQPADLHDFLAASVPDYMVPAHFHRLDALPLTENGKVNKKRLAVLARTLGQDVAAYVPPATETERRLVTAWAEILGIPIGRIGRADSFFQLGGTSLAAVRLVVKLDRLISLRQLVANPVLGDLAALVDGCLPAAAASAPRADLLQRLSSMQREPVASLVCFPYAGGNAVNFQRLAIHLEHAGVAVYGVELPAHDVARPGETLAGVAEIARRVWQEIQATVAGPILLWGHCAGTAHALEVARLLEASGRDPVRVFAGALLLDDPATLRREIQEVSELGNRELTARLHEDSAYVELDLLKAERAELVGQAYRHDVCSTNQHLIAVQDQPARHRLRAPLDVVVAADDPTTTSYQWRHPRWELVAGTVTLRVLDEGGHYFTRTRPADVAAIVAARVTSMESRSA